MLGEHWIKNNTQVYFMFTPRRGQEIRSGLWSESEDGDFYRLNSLLGFFSRAVDVESFALVTDYLAADKSQVYLALSSVLTGVQITGIRISVSMSSLATVVGSMIQFSIV